MELLPAADPATQVYALYPGCEPRKVEVADCPPTLQNVNSFDGLTI